MRYHDITKADMLNGEGLRVVLWTSGCPHHCHACQNVITWDPTDGLEFDEEAKGEIFTELSHSWCSGLTLSGGDPLFESSRETIASLVEEVKDKFPEKTIWCYTGYTFERLQEECKQDQNLAKILNHLDVLLDGKFVLRYANERLHYVGSSNQCIIDVKKSLEENKKVLYIDNDKVLEEMKEGEKYENTWI